MLLTPCTERCFTRASTPICGLAERDQWIQLFGKWGVDEYDSPPPLTDNYGSCSDRKSRHGVPLPDLARYLLNKSIEAMPTL